jgi:tetratricopeptide (TPR) repeat protein
VTIDRRIIGFSIAMVCVWLCGGMSAQTASVQLEPARAGLRPVPLPRLDDLEPAVSNHLREAERAFRTQSDGGSLSGAKLADAYGAFGRLFHAYEFFDSAEACYLNAARLSPGNATWSHLLGYLYQQTGRLRDAAERFEQAVRLQPDDRAAAVRLGQVYLGLNRLRDAREAFEGLVMVFPALARYGLGEVALRERRFNDAVEYFRAALERVPQASSLHYSLAMAYRGLGRMDEARSHLAQQGSAGIAVGDPIVDSLQTLVRSERGLVAQGRRAYEAGQFQQASDAFSRALDVAPTSTSARMNLGLAQLQLGNTPAAVSHLRSAFEQAPDDPDVTRELLRLLLRLRRDDEAIQVLMKSAAIKPDDEEIVVGLSIALSSRDRFAEAVALVDDANRRFPDRTATATTLARLLASSPDRSIRNGRRALELAMEIQERDPTPAHSETIALALAELERCDDALASMKRAIADAEQIRDVIEAARLRRELPKYETSSCRR